jgi:tRNA pseudouridine55 synthase
LRRTQAGVFGLEHAWTLEALAKLGTETGNGIERAMLHPRTVLPEMPCVSGDAGALGKLRNGNQANLADFSEAEVVKVFAGQRELVAVAKRVAGTLFQPMMVLG